MSGHAGEQESMDWTDGTGRQQSPTSHDMPADGSDGTGLLTSPTSHDMPAELRDGTGPQQPPTSHDMPAELRDGTGPQQPPTSHDMPAEGSYGTGPQQSPTSHDMPAEGSDGTGPQQSPTSQAKFAGGSYGTGPQQPPTSHDMPAEGSDGTGLLTSPTSHDMPAEGSDGTGPQQSPTSQAKFAGGSYGTGPQQPPTSHDMPAEAQATSPQNKDGVQVTLTVKWSEGAQRGFNQQKYKNELQINLQSWANKNEFPGEFTVLNVSEDGSAMIRIEPAPAVTELQRLSGLTLTKKGDSAKTVTIMSVSLTPPELKTQIPEDASMTFRPSSGPQDEQMKLPKKSSSSSSAAVSTAGMETCTVPVSHFWYVNHIYKEEIRRIMKENGVKFNADVNMTFEADRHDGDPEQACSEFTNLVQKCLGDSNGSIVPLKYIDPEELKDTLKIIQRPENKLLLTLSSEEMTVCGPRQSQDAISKSLNATTLSVGESTWASQDTSPNIGMSIKDPLVDAGLTMEEGLWRLLTTSFNKQVAKIKAKFGVDFKASDIGKGKVKVKACYKRSEGNASMESHAVRGLLHLYQKIATSPTSFSQHHGAMALNGSNMRNVYQPERSSRGPVWNGQSGYSMRNTEAPAGEGATARDDKDENCPICFDTFTNKKQLKCKHEFCEECLARSKKSMGPICPVCKDVFGMIEGDQPQGRMSSYPSTSSLPGFQQFGTLVITYDIPGGIQTEKHPNPGHNYSGINRTAYLPDNKEGKEVLRLLRKAFDQKLIFTVGTSRTTGLENQVTWNDIHHKTSTTGGPQNFGYPDTGYLSRVREELKAKGIE